MKLRVHLYKDRRGRYKTEGSNSLNRTGLHEHEREVENALQIYKCAHKHETKALNVILRCVGQFQTDMEQKKECVTNVCPHAHTAENRTKKRGWKCPTKLYVKINHRLRKYTFK